MDAVLLARTQFAFTIAFHWIFPSLTVGFSWLNVVFMTKYFRAKSGSEEELEAKKAVRFWLKLFTITFAVGVATGLTMALQFGTNWANYSKTIGDVIGPALAAEVILSFFLESTFLGVILFGWEKVSKRTLWISMVLVAVGTIVSAFWIIVVDSWMQTPAGFTKLSDGTIIMSNFVVAVLNHSTILRFLHTVTASFVVASFFVFGISSYYHLRHQNEFLVKFSFKTAMTIIFFGSILLLIFGHLQAGVVADYQPAKFAVYELVKNTSSSEPFPALAIIDPFDGSTLFAIFVPFFTLGDIMLQGHNRVYQGYTSYPKSDLPPFAITVYTFHIMILLGLIFIAFGVIGVILMYRGRIYESKLYNKIYLILAVFAIPLPFIATQLGWMAAEVGRQPCVVYDPNQTAGSVSCLLTTNNAISVSVPDLQLLLSLVGFMLIYGLLFLLWITLLVKTIYKGPAEILDDHSVKSAEGQSVTSLEGHSVKTQEAD